MVGTGGTTVKHIDPVITDTLRIKKQAETPSSPLTQFSIFHFR